MVFAPPYPPTYLSNMHFINRGFGVAVKCQILISACYNYGGKTFSYLLFLFLNMLLLFVLFNFFLFLAYEVCYMKSVKEILLVLPYTECKYSNVFYIIIIITYFFVGSAMIYCCGSQQLHLLQKHLKTFLMVLDYLWPASSSTLSVKTALVSLNLQFIMVIHFINPLELQ